MLPANLGPLQPHFSPVPFPLLLPEVEDQDVPVARAHDEVRLRARHGVDPARQVQHRGAGLLRGRTRVPRTNGRVPRAGEDEACTSCTERRTHAHVIWTLRYRVHDTHSHVHFAFVIPQSPLLGSHLTHRTAA